jgi:thioredoxin 1
VDEFIIFGILLGATLGFGLVLFLWQSGDTPPKAWRPYGGALLGALVGGLLAGSLPIGKTDYLPSPYLLEIQTPAAFDRDVLGAGRPVLVEFYTQQCLHCRRLLPVMHALADRFAGKANVAKIDVGKLEAIGRRYRVEAVPTLLLFVGGREEQRVLGYKDEAYLAAIIDQHVGPVDQPGPAAPGSTRGGPAEGSNTVEMPGAGIATRMLSETERLR